MAAFSEDDVCKKLQFKSNQPIAMCCSPDTSCASRLRKSQLIFGKTMSRLIFNLAPRVVSTNNCSSTPKNCINEIEVFNFYILSTIKYKFKIAVHFFCLPGVRQSCISLANNKIMTIALITVIVPPLNVFIRKSSKVLGQASNFLNTSESVIFSLKLRRSIYYNPFFKKVVSVTKTSVNIFVL